MGKGLSNHGFTLYTATDIASSLEIINANDHIDFLINDYDLLGENGLKVAKAFSEKYHGKCAIAVFTSHTDLMVRKEVTDYLLANPIKTGFRLIFKPVDRNVILEWLSDAGIELERRL